MSLIRNTVVVAVMQVGVIVAGVLAAGLCHKGFASQGVAVPVPAAMLYSYGVVGLFIPLAWGAGALALLIRPGVSEEVRTLIFWSGVLLLIALSVFIIYADVTPWLHVLGKTGGGEDDLSSQRLNEIKMAAQWAGAWQDGFEIL
jgi:hypothetical protein